jgi:hypothetical protein
VVATHTINKKDRSALSAIAIETKESLDIETYTALFDKGYYNGKQIEICKKANITTIVAQPEQGKNKERIAEDYLVSKFKYDQTTDTCTCPHGETFKTTGSWYKKPLKETVMSSKDTEHPNAENVM